MNSWLSPYFTTTDDVGLIDPFGPAEAAIVMVTGAEVGTQLNPQEMLTTV